MAELTVQTISESGLNPSYSAAAAGGDTFQNNSRARRFVHVKNGGASSIDVTVAPEQASLNIDGYGQMTKSSISVAVPAGEDRMIGPFPAIAFGINPDIQYSDVTSVTVAALGI